MCHSMLPQHVFKPPEPWIEPGVIVSCLYVFWILQGLSELSTLGSRTVVAAGLRVS